MSVFHHLVPPVRWGIIGCGDVCEVKSGPAFYKTDGSSLVAVMRRDAAKAEDFARRHGVACWHTDAQQLIDNPEVDAVYVATPPSTHAAYAVRVMRAGKPVYVEKPMATSYAECLEMNRVAEQTGMPLLVAYYRRSLPYFLWVKKLLDSRCIGTPHLVRVDFRAAASGRDKDDKHLPWRVQPHISGGGYFYDMACHTLDILDFLLGEISEVHGFTANCAGLYDAEDTVTACFRFSSGVIGSGEWLYASPENEQPHDYVEIKGSKGIISFSTFSFAPVLLHKDTAKTCEEWNFSRPEHIQQPMIKDITAFLCGKGTPSSDGISAARTNRVMDTILGKLPPPSPVHE
ncbi:MAG: Gfo/Idh/MocA family oxidoreductase [Bacteroidales bacterium]|jgi:predicted dehydrogenase|nr:Gfo/Idh/MocA family oxidoreductase [Bacteroidales bacterium]